MEDLPLVHWCCQHALNLMQDSLAEFYRNLPVRPVAGLLRLLAFPLGRRFRGPSDALGHEVAALVLAPSPARDRLSNGIYVSADEGEASGRIDHALERVVAVAALERKLQDAVRQGQIRPGSEEQLLDQAAEAGILDAQQAARYRSALAARREVIQVDDFPADYWNRE